ncbi:CBS domain-containing protein [Amycolatopsis sp. NPDC059657]|uniref:CBS domain-containing protein n=1 Tax=Amycolatopsis sp. NPDC059657 TaxID=3346899 RepID=UPI00366EC3FE
MLVREIMSYPVSCLPPDASVAHAAVLLNGKGFAAAPVVDARDRLVGIVSETDLMTAHRGKTVAEVMTAKVHTVTSDTTVAELVTLLLRRGVRSAPVVDGYGVVVGIVARRDVMRAVVHDDDLIAKQVRYRLAGYWGEGRRWDVEADDGVVTVTGDFRDEGERGVIRALAEIVPGVTTVKTRLRGAVSVCDRIS